jgi:7-cyano-7-deazaguanine synthase
LYIDYGQKASKPETEAVGGLASYFKVPLTFISFDAGRSFAAGEIRGRNAFFVFAALLCNIGNQGLIVAGIHAGTPYFDCSEEFVEQTDRLVQAHTDGRYKFLAPLASWSKKDIFTYAIREELPLNLTYSCEAGEIPPCGMCLSCQDRRALDARK